MTTRGRSSSDFLAMYNSPVLNVVYGAVHDSLLEALKPCPPPSATDEELDAWLAKAIPIEKAHRELYERCVERMRTAQDKQDADTVRAAFEEKANLEGWGQHVVVDDMRSSSVEAAMPDGWVRSSRLAVGPKFLARLREALSDVTLSKEARIRDVVPDDAPEELGDFLTTLSYHNHKVRVNVSKTKQAVVIPKTLPRYIGA